MGFRDEELEFIDKYSELIEKGPDGLQELIEKMGQELDRSSRLRILLAYNCLGVGAFDVATKTDPLDRLITGALFNRTACRAKGEPLLPSLFKSKTKVILYNIQKGAIVDQKKYTLVDKTSLDNESLSGNYNLCVLDKPEHTDSVAACFDGRNIYSAKLVLHPTFLNHHSVSTSKSVECIGESKAKQLLAEAIKDSLNARIGDFKKVVEDIMVQVEKNLIF